VNNVNNTGEAEKMLNVFTYDDGTRLPTDASLSALVASKQIQSGSSVILERSAADTLDVSNRN